MEEVKKEKSQRRRDRERESNVKMTREAREKIIKKIKYKATVSLD